MGDYGSSLPPLGICMLHGLDFLLEEASARLCVAFLAGSLQAIMRRVIFDTKINRTFHWGDNNIRIIFRPEIDASHVV
jgi:hypothetical protein